MKFVLDLHFRQQQQQQKEQQQQQKQMNLLAWCVKFGKMINHQHIIITFLRIKQHLMFALHITDTLHYATVTLWIVTATTGDFHSN